MVWRACADSLAQFRAVERRLSGLTKSDGWVVQPKNAAELHFKSRKVPFFMLRTATVELLRVQRDFDVVHADQHYVQFLSTAVKREMAYEDHDLSAEEELFYETKMCVLGRLIVKRDWRIPYAEYENLTDEERSEWGILNARVEEFDR